jgi:ankyrin repeat protein
MSHLRRILDAIRARDLGALKEALPPSAPLPATRTESGESVVLAALYHQQPEMVACLLAHGPSLDLFEATAVGDSHRVTEILAEGQADPSGFASDGWTALHLACFFGHEHIVRLLIDSSVHPHPVSRNATANQPIHAAAVTGRLSIVRLLLDRGADIEAVAAGGFTPLMLAAGAGHSATVEFLVARGARRRTLSADGKSAADLARARNHTGLATWLDPSAPTATS